MSKIKDFCVVSRLPLLIGSLASPLIGTALGAGSLAVFLSIPVLAYFILYYLIIIFACNVNCLFDINVDEKYKKFMSNAVKSLGIRNVKAAIAIELVGISSLVFWLFSQGFYTTAIISIFGVLFALIYSAEPVRIKKRGFWSPFPVLIGLYTLPILGGWFIFQSILPVYMIVFVIGYALINEGITLVNTVEDNSEDQKEGIRTWSHVFGMRKTLISASIFTFAGYATVISLLMLNPLPSIASSVLLIISVLSIFIVFKHVTMVLRADDLEKSAKKHARKMPKWFVTVRFPLLFTVLSLLL